MSFPRYPEYKDSGVKWLDGVPAYWEVSPFKRLVEIHNGADHKHVERDDGYPVIGSGGLFAYASDYLYDGESVLLGRKGTIDKPLYVMGKFWTVDTMYWTKIAQNACGRFVYYAALTIPFNYYSTNTALPSMTKGALNAHAVARPPLEEQTAIATFLDRETAKIDVLVAEQQKLIDLLKETRQAVISHAVTKGLDHSAPMKDSGVEWLGEVPAHWEVVRLGALFREASDEGREDRPILSVSIHDGVSDRELDEIELDRTVTRSDDRTKYKCVEPGDLVYNMMRAWQGGFGTVEVPGMVSPAYVVARPRFDFLTTVIEQQLRTSNAVEEMRRHSRGVTDFRLRLYWDEFKTIHVVLPPKTEQLAITSYISHEAGKFDALTAEAQRAIELLKEHRSALISTAVTGKIDVRSLTASEAA
ncbi:MAG: restriction endonuclease subunit S [Thiobacillaceae bacterium]